ncbi:MAG: hypothetical protein V2B20_22205, partial [Pseudomonadota bacterium]
NNRNKVLVVANFNVEPQILPIEVLRSSGFFQMDGMKDLCSGERLHPEDDSIVIPALTSYWLVD